MTRLLAPGIATAVPILFIHHAANKSTLVAGMMDGKVQPGAPAGLKHVLTRLLDTRVLPLAGSTLDILTNALHSLSSIA